jgi:hypothetical protein
MPPRQFYLDMTNHAHLSGPRHLDSFIVTPNARPLIGTLQKRMPTLTRTATNQTAGPLAKKQRDTTLRIKGFLKFWYNYCGFFINQLNLI